MTSVTSKVTGERSWACKHFHFLTSVLIYKLNSICKIFLAHLKISLDVQHSDWWLCKICALKEAGTKNNGRNFIFSFPGFVAALKCVSIRFHLSPPG